jgi:hypothetical protein
VIATRDSLCGMTSPHNRPALDRVGQRAAGRRRIISATAMTAAGGAALALTFGTVFAQGAAADTAAKSPQPPATDGWVAPAALQQQVPAPAPAPAPAPRANPTTSPKKKVAATTPAPPPAPPAAAPETSEPTASTGGS